MKKIFIISSVLASFFAMAQEQYEIQVYESPTQPKNTLMAEIHSNIAIAGPKSDPAFSHPLHETLELTQGFTDNFEVGFYFFNRINNGCWQYMGSHIRPRITAPARWGWKWGASLSTEIGLTRNPVTSKFETDYEIRPIIDRTFGKEYFSFNPTLDGNFNEKEFSFSPNIKWAHNFSPQYSLGVEYYGSVGSPFRWEQYSYQTHQVFLALDYNVSPKYEVNFGIGHGFTQTSDMWDVKLILGEQFIFGKNKK